MTHCTYLVFFMVSVFECTNTLPQATYGGQINFPRNYDPSYQGQRIAPNAMTYPIPGSSWNYGGNARQFDYLSAQSHEYTNQGSYNIYQQHRLPLRDNPVMRNIIQWSTVSTKNNGIQLQNRYQPGSQGWYATGGNNKRSNAQLTLLNPCLLITSVMACLLFHTGRQI